MTQTQGPVISVMLAVADTPAAVEWYKRALGATVLWSLGSVAGATGHDELRDHQMPWGTHRQSGFTDPFWAHLAGGRSVATEPIFALVSSQPLST
jgi:hypothetical protein